MDILDGEVGNKRGRVRPRLEYFPLIMKEKDSWDLKKSVRVGWHGLELSGSSWLHQTSFRIVYLKMTINLNDRTELAGRNA